MNTIITKASHEFSNGVVVVNATPHAITFLDGDTIVSVPSSVPEGERTGKLVINARAIEEACGPFKVRTRFVGNDDGEAIIAAIKAVFPDEAASGHLMIVGSLIAANTYHDVVGMVPAPGYERVPPAEKRMSCAKFNQGEA